MTFNEIIEVFQAIDRPMNGLPALVHSCRQVNKGLWHFEDQARMKDCRPRIAHIKEEIDSHNQERNNLIHQMDSFFATMLMEGTPGGRFYAESPGMIIDRMAILHIKKKKLEELLPLIEETELQHEYYKRAATVTQQLDDLGGFLDTYLAEVAAGKVFFRVYGPTKMYNDERIWKYIRTATQPQ